MEIIFLSSLLVRDCRRLDMPDGSESSFQTPLDTCGSRECFFSNGGCRLLPLTTFWPSAELDARSQEGHPCMPDPPLYAGDISTVSDMINVRRFSSRLV